MPNESFEDTIACPISPGDMNKCANWYNPTNATPDYFNSCSNWLSTVSVGVPGNGAGYQYAKTGFAYAGFGCVFDSSVFNFREYIQVKLKQKLIQGKIYDLNFFASKGDSVAYSLVGIGAAITVNSLTCSCDTSISFTPQIKYNFLLNDSANWTNISGTYLSIGGEEYLTIGYFRNNFFPDTVRTFNTANLFSYYYIDDVKLTEKIEVVTTPTLLIPELISPNGDNLNDDFEVSQAYFKKEDFHAEIFNRWGNSVFQSSEPNFKWNGERNGGKLPTGTYFVLIRGITYKGEEFSYKGFVQLTY